ncbi:MAG: hypothetical protein HC930_03135 [Hydrococcus sp. SU_1_0]|nr:hypothetical protein [Hydrococcus sp. SU_1_0]
MDDTFVLFRDEKHVDLFLNYLNEQHVAIKFTYETEMHGKMNFLDVCIEKTGASFETKLYRKKTNTGLGLKYDSAVDFKYKCNLISCLVDRAYKICSTYKSFAAELEYLRSFFYKNFFPLSFIEKMFRLKIAETRFKKPLIFTVPKKVIYCSLPFVNQYQNISVKKDIQHLISKYYPQINLRIIFTNRFNVASFFRYSDRMPALLRSCVVYKFKCSQCEATYCGETARHFTTRIAEHRGLSSRTGLVVQNPLHSSIRDHSQKSDHPIHVNDFKILSSCERQNLKLLESILIHRSRPTLNGTDSSVPLGILD